VRVSWRSTARLGRSGSGLVGVSRRGVAWRERVRYVQARCGLGFVVLCSTVRLGGACWGEGFTVWAGEVGSGAARRATVRVLRRVTAG